MKNKTNNKKENKMTDEIMDCFDDVDVERETLNEFLGLDDYEDDMDEREEIMKKPITLKLEWWKLLETDIDGLNEMVDELCYDEDGMIGNIQYTPIGIEDNKIVFQVVFVVE